MPTTSDPERRSVSFEPSLGFFGPALARHDGWVTTQGEVLAELFRRDGFKVHLSSTKRNPLGRAVDHVVDLARWGRSLDVAMVSVFSGRAFALADEALTMAGALGIPTVAWLHGGNLPLFAADHPRWVERVLRRADEVVAPTSYLERWASQTVSADVVPNVLDLDATPYRERSRLTPRLLWMRTFHELYDPPTAVRVLAALRSSGVSATLTMAGQDKGLRSETELLARGLGVAEWLEFPGFVTGPTKAALLDRHDIFLNTNLVDNAPVGVLEAASAGLAIVSTNVGGLPDLLEDGSTGLLVSPGQPEAMATAVKRLLHDPGLAGRMTVAGRGMAIESSWPAVRRRWLEVWARLPVRPGHRREPG